MRMASGRGQSHFNVTDFLQPILGNMNLVKYPLNKNTSDAYYPEGRDEVKDKMSFLPACLYASESSVIGEHCKEFEPVVTDLGVCYSFNAKSSMKMLKESSFTDAFQEAYGTELLDSTVRYTEGAGDKFSLRFMIDNNKYLRRKSKTWPFKIVISGHESYFDALSVAKKALPGYETTFDIEPIEVVGTANLHKIEQKARKCRFSDEIEDDSMFKSYSQTSCEYECRINKARKKCGCTPWNFPTPPTMSKPTICDLYGSSCFHYKMNEGKIIKSCTRVCPSDCEIIRFSINKEIEPIDVASYCEKSTYSGALLTKALFYSADGSTKDYYSFVHNYFRMGNDTGIDDVYGDREIYWQKQCLEIMANEVAIVKVRLETNKYMKTVKDRRLSFADKLAAFGN